MRTISENPAIQAHYEECLSNGCSDSLAEMLAFRAPPRLETDTSYEAYMNTASFQIEGGKRRKLGRTLAEQFKGAESQLARIVAIAKSQGYTPNANDRYYPELADFPGDKRAFVKSNHKAHIKKVCEAKGVPCYDDDGNVIVKHEVKAPPKRVKLAADIVERERRNRIAKDPGLAKKDQRAVREQIVAEHSYG